MIIATVNGQHFILETIKDAEQVLSIFARAQPVERAYDTDYQGYFYPDSTCDCSVEFSSRDLVSTEEHQRRRAAKESKSSAEAPVTT